VSRNHLNRKDIYGIDESAGPAPDRNKSPYFRVPANDLPIEEDPSAQPSCKCRILTLDGGGAKGFYSLGVLKQLEALLGGGPLSNQFDLIFGTSTGTIIAALLALGRPVDHIKELYEKHVPHLMALRWSWRRTRALEKLADEVFGELRFDAFQTGIGIVAARWREKRPMIFKASVAQAHGMHATFKPGFGCTIAEAVVASCSAYPFFRRKIVRTSEGSEVELLDGGYCANNPTLYAIADAVKPLKNDPQSLRVVSVGVGVYPEPLRYAHKWLIANFFLVRLLQKTLDINTHSMETLARLLFKDVPLVRINDEYSTPDMATDLMEHDIKKLRLLYQRGWDSFGKHEDDLKKLLLAK
jgi:predicted acylesterase/phospholipase RssA